MLNQPLAAQTTSTWIGGGGSNIWFDPANWDSGVPNGSFFAIIDSGVSVDTGNSSSIQVERLTLGINDVLNINNNSDFIIDTTANAGSGVIFNEGNINLTTSGNLTDLAFSGSVELTGGGIMTMGGGNNNARILDQSGTTGIFTNVDNTIQGKGQIGVNTTEIINSGLIDANDNTGTLTLDPRNTGSQFTNTGTLRASNGGELILEGFGGGKFLNSGGLIEALDGSTVQLSGVGAVVGGTLDTSGTGRIVVGPSDNGELEDVSLTGRFDVENNGDLELKGVIDNSGQINVSTSGNLTDIQIAGNVSLTGGGTITLGGSNDNSRILDETGLAGVLTNVDNTIQGEGEIGANRTEIINSGLIDANDNTGTLTLDPRNTGSQFTNTGTLRASNGGELILEGSGGGKFLNTGGLIEALDGSTVQLSGIGAVVGGTLDTSGTGRIVVGPSDNGELEDVSLTGRLDVENNTDLELKGIINNSGQINVATAGNFTDIQIAGNVSLTGGGTVTLGGSNNNSRILDETGLAGVLTNVDNTIQGEGEIGANRTEIINSGLIDANDNTGTLTLDPRNTGSQFTNTGTLRASNGGELILEGSGGGKFLNTGGLIEALDGSTVQLSGIGAVVGGTLDTSGTGRIVVGPSDNGELEDVSLTGRLDVENNTDLELKGIINNSGQINVATAGNFTDIQIAGNVSLTGGGTVTLGGSNNNSRILDETGTVGILTNVDNTIRGRGNIGFNRMILENQASGVISAGINGASLILDNRGTSIDNHGTFQAINGGTLSVEDDLTNNGTIHTTAISLVEIDGVLTNTGLGSLTGNGEIDADNIINDGRIAPAQSVGTLLLDSDLDLGSTSLVEIELDSQGNDLLNVSGILDLDGELQVELLAGFLPSDSDVFTVVSSNSLSGAFANVANGGLLGTAGGRGTFVVNYGAGSPFDSNAVVLSGFTAIPEPGTASLILLVGGMMCLRRRKRQS